MEKITYSVADLANVLGISLSSAYTLANRSDFPSLRVGNRLLVSRIALESWINQQTAIKLNQEN